MISELARQASRLSAADFLKQVTPASKRSKLSPWAAEIKLLREAGCSLAQIRQLYSPNTHRTGPSIDRTVILEESNRLEFRRMDTAQCRKHTDWYTYKYRI